MSDFIERIEDYGRESYLEIGSIVFPEVFLSSASGLIQRCFKDSRFDYRRNLLIMAEKDSAKSFMLKNVLGDILRDGMNVGYLSKASVGSIESSAETEAVYNTLRTKTVKHFVPSYWMDNDIVIISEMNSIFPSSIAQKYESVLLDLLEDGKFEKSMIRFASLGEDEKNRAVKKYKDNNLKIEGAKVSYRVYSPTIMCSHLNSRLWQRFSPAFYSRFIKCYIPSELKTPEFVKHVFKEGQNAMKKNDGLKEDFKRISRLKLVGEPKIEDAEIDQIVEEWQDNYGLRNTKIVINTILAKALLSEHLSESMNQEGKVVLKPESEDIEYGKKKIQTYVDGENQLDKLTDNGYDPEKEIFSKLVFDKGMKVEELTKAFGKSRATLFRWQKNLKSQVS